MKARFLFPHWFRYLGVALVALHIPIMLFRKMIGFDAREAPASAGLFGGHHLFFMCTTLTMAVGLFMLAFSKEKVEDEQIKELRLDSLQWAIYFNYLLLTISLVLSTDTEHVLFLNLMVPLLFFIIRFQWRLFQNNRLIKDKQL